MLGRLDGVQVLDPCRGAVLVLDRSRFRGLRGAPRVCLVELVMVGAQALCRRECTLQLALVISVAASHPPISCRGSHSARQHDDEHMSAEPHEPVRLIYGSPDS